MAAGSSADRPDASRDAHVHSIGPERPGSSIALAFRPRTPYHGGMHSFPAIAIAALIGLSVPAVADAQPLSVGGAKTRARYFSTAEVVRLEHRGVEVNRFKIIRCTRKSSSTVDCVVSFRRLDGEPVCSERVRVQYTSENQLIPKARRLSGCR